MTTADVQTVGEDPRNSLAEVDQRVHEGEVEIARQRAVIQRAARTHQNTAPQEARLGAYLHEHAARVAQRHRLQGELATWLANKRRSIRVQERQSDPSSL